MPGDSESSLGSEEGRGKGFERRTTTCMQKDSDLDGDANDARPQRRCNVGLDPWLFAGAFSEANQNRKSQNGEAQMKEGAQRRGHRQVVSGHMRLDTPELEAGHAGPQAEPEQTDWIKLCCSSQRGTPQQGFEIYVSNDQATSCTECKLTAHWRESVVQSGAQNTNNRGASRSVCANDHLTAHMQSSNAYDGHLQVLSERCDGGCARRG